MMKERGKRDQVNGLKKHRSKGYRVCTETLVLATDSVTQKQESVIWDHPVITRKYLNWYSISSTTIRKHVYILTLHIYIHIFEASWTNDLGKFITW